MRAGWNSRLAERLQRSDPAARVIVEAVATEAEDVRLTPAHWAAAQITDGSVARLDDGGVTLGRDAAAAIVANATSDGFTSDFQPDTDLFHCARLDWLPGNTHREISLVRLHLVAQLNPALPQEVAWWKLTLRRLRGYRSIALDQQLDLQPIAPPVTVAASGGTAAGDVDFDFAALGIAPVVGDDPESADGAGSASGPVVLLMLEALTSDGSPAANVGWASDSAQTEVTNLPVTLTDYTLARGLGEAAGLYRRGLVGGSLPRCAVFSGTYAPATIGFSLVGTRLELDALTDSMDIELAGVGETPGGSSLTYEVSADAATWYEYSDGDLVGAGDLSAVPRQAYYYLRATLTPGSGGTASPVLRMLGVRSIRSIDLDGLAGVQVDGWSIDPITMAGRITEAEIKVIRDGDRDYRDLATELLSLYYTAELRFRIWVGHPDLPRAQWLHIDSFLVDDYDSTGSAITFSCLSSLVVLSTALPVPDTSVPDNVTREPLGVGPAPIATVYSALLDAAGIAGRYLGPGIPSTAVDPVQKSIDDSSAKTEIDALAYLAGGGITSSQGRIRFADMLGSRVPRAVFPSSEISVQQVTPGLRQRLPEFYIPHSWDGERYAQEARAFHAPSLLNIGTLGLDAPPRLDDVVAQWIHTAELADEVGTRTVKVLGAGLMLWRFRSTYAHPYLEPGDAVLVETDRFVARDPNTGAALKGALWALGVVQAVADPLGREFTIWVRGYADLVPSTESIDRSGYPTEEQRNLQRGLIGFRPIRRTPGSRTWGWAWGSDVLAIKVQIALLPQPVAADPWPDEEDAGTEPNLEDPNTDVEYTFSEPPPGYELIGQMVPILTDGTAGHVQRVHLVPTGTEPDLINSISVLVNDDDGSVAVQIDAASRTGSYRYAFTVGASPAWPAVAAVEAGVVRAIAGSDTLLLPAGTVAYNQTIRVRVAPYVGVDGTGTDGAGDHGEIRAAEDLRDKPPLELEVTTESDTSPTTGSHGVTLRDPGGYGTLLHVRTKAGEAPLTAWTLVATRGGSPALVSGTEYLQTVALIEGHQSYIEWRLTYVFNGATLYLYARSNGLDKGAIPNISIVPKLEYNAATASCVVNGDSDTVGAKVAASTSGFPSLATVQAQTMIPGRVLTSVMVGSLLTSLLPGAHVYFSGIGIGPNGEESTALSQAEAIYTPVAATLDTPIYPDDDEFGVTVRDPGACSTGLYYRSKSGISAYSAWALITATPANGSAYSQTVPLVEGHFSFIEFRLDSLVGGRSESRYLESAGIDAGYTPDASIIPIILEPSGNASCSLVGDSDTAGYRVLARTDRYPTAIEVDTTGVLVVGRTVGPDDVGTLATAANGQVVYFAARALAIGGSAPASGLIKAKQTRGAYLKPTVQASGSRSGANAVFSLSIADPIKRVTAVQYRIRDASGTLSAWSSSWTSSTGTPGVDASLSRSYTISSPAGNDVTWEWQVVYNDEDGVSQVIGDTVPVANLQAFTSTITLPAASFLPIDDATPFTYRDGLLSTNGGSTTHEYIATPVLPQGVTLTAFRLRGDRTSLSDGLSAALWRRTGLATASSIAIITHNTVGDQTVSAVINQLVGSEVFYIDVGIKNHGGFDDAQLYYVQLDLSIPSYSKVL